MAGQAQQLAVVVNLHPLAVHLKRPLSRRHSSSFTRGHAFENGLDPCGHFTRTEGFDHVIIGADFQPHHAVDFLAAGRKEDHRHLGKAPQSLASLEAADIRQADIENQQISGITLLLNQGLLGQA